MKTQLFNSHNDLDSYGINLIIDLTTDNLNNTICEK
jgi:hypothetical protein